MVVIPHGNRGRIRVKAMNQMRVVRSLVGARGVVGIVLAAQPRLGAPPATMITATGPIEPNR